MESGKQRNILYGRDRLGPFPMERLKRVDQPTNVITEDVQRIDLRDTAYGLAARGEYGPVVQVAVGKKQPEKYPLSAAQKDLIDHIALIESKQTAKERAPIPHEPEILTRHIKAVGYFLKADIMASCKAPASAYYSHDKQGVPIVRHSENFRTMMR